MMKPGSITVLCVLVSALLSCSPPRNTYSTEKEGSKAGDTARILFLDYQISRDSISQTYEAQLLSMLIRDGKIKESRTVTGPPEDGDLELLILDPNEHTLIQRLIPNPLDRSVEYVNNAGQFEHRMIHLDSTQFSIRLQMEPGASSILLNRFIGDEPEARPLLKISIL